MTLKRRFRVLRNSASAKALLAAPLALIGTQVFAASLPANGKYVAGVGAIQNSASSLTIDQSSPHGIIDWQSFSIGAGKIVRFDNGSGATLNMVTGNDLSQIAGSLTATGSVYLVNPAGVVVTSSGRVVTEGSFSATTGNATGAIANAGSITSAGGNVTLSGGNLSDTGSVAVMRGGHIWLTGTNTADIGGTIDADNANGKGGSITAEGKTLTVSGVLTARGTTAGGSIETSGHSVDMSGARVDAGASHGKDGTWLIDPDDLTIDSSAASSIDAALDAGTNVVE